ncbi:MAG: YgeY family selenium metabolism-linked hydrolase [Oscillochloris sp.]|nr:YgeY family selenium metabolism-linked hydrolase [Oscillochloris sp.]
MASTTLTSAQSDRVIALCRDLVRAESLAGRESAAAAVAEQAMRELGYDEVFVDPYGSVVGVIKGAAPGPNLHFDGHLDVVPATARNSWQHDPFGGELSAGRIWGRGATDMKGPDAAMLCAAAFVRRNELRGSVTVSLSVGEEELEGEALKMILRRRPADFVVIGENSNLAVGIGQKGRAGLRLSATGIPAHSSRPEEGKNAVYALIEAIERVRALPLPADDLLGPAVCELVEIVSSPFPGTSIVPDGCRARFDRRLVRGETPESLLAELRAALQDLSAVQIDLLDVTLPCYTGAVLRKPDFHAAWETPHAGVLLRAAEAALGACGLPVAHFTARYCSNGSASAAELGIPTIILGPSDPALAHTIDEYIAVDELERGCAVYIALIEQILRT